MENVSRLEEAAMLGDINNLYEVIQQCPRILEEVDAIPFFNTPLHIAASAGHVHFAIQIMTLKPSFASRLNQQGFSPIHIALQTNNHNLVHRLVNIKKELVRVKGKEDLTPLHFVCVAESDENIALLIDFLEACPDSVEDVNVRSETALHIAVRYGNVRALRVLVGWLRRNIRDGADVLERSSMNRKDEAGNTILHMSILTHNKEAVELLIKSEMMNKNAKNLQGSTALDLADGSPEIRRILVNAEARRGQSIRDPNHEVEIASKIPFYEKITIGIHRIRRNMTAAQREAYMVVAALVVTAIYQWALSPPGGVYQADSGDNNLNATSSFNLTAAAAPRKAGKSVLPSFTFFVITAFNTTILLMIVLNSLLLMPSGRTGILLVLMWLSFVISYIVSLIAISPTNAASTVSLALADGFIIVVLFGALIGLSRKLRALKAARYER